MYHAIHAFGLAELLKTGVVAKVDDDHYWNLVDNTYIDDVSSSRDEESSRDAEFSRNVVSSRNAVSSRDVESLSDNSRSTKQCLQEEHQYTTTNSICRRLILQH